MLVKWQNQQHKNTEPSYRKGGNRQQRRDGISASLRWREEEHQEHLVTFDGWRWNKHRAQYFISKGCQKDTAQQQRKKACRVITRVHACSESLSSPTSTWCDRLVFSNRCLRQAFKRFFFFCNLQALRAMCDDITLLKLTHRTTPGKVWPPCESGTISMIITSHYIL